jgi:hypothetical protein
MLLTPLLSFGLAALAQPVPGADILVHGQRLPFRAPRATDPELATMRGGMMLANGFDVAIGIDIQTRIDGVLALHTIYASEGPNAGIGVYTDGTKPAPPVPATVTVETPARVGVPLVEVDRSAGGTRVSPLTQSPATTVNLVNGIQASWATAEGQTQVPVVANGPPVAGPPGDFSLARDDRGVVVTLAAPMLEVRHLIGSATGIVVANSGNDRVIDTVNSVNVDLRGAQAAIVPSLLAAQSAVLEGLRSGR